MPKAKSKNLLVDLYKSAVNETNSELDQIEARARFLRSLGSDFEFDAARFEDFANKTKSLLEKERALLLGAITQVESNASHLSHQNSVSAQNGRSASSAQGKATRKIAKQVISELERLGSKRGAKEKAIKGFMMKNDPESRLGITEKQVRNCVDHMLRKKNSPNS